MSFRTIARGLRFPEGPIAMPDGSVVLVEIGRGTLTRVRSNGAVEVIAELGGGPNGAAIGPDGKCYVCNNGGFKWIDRNGRLYPSEQPDDYRGGSIQRVDLISGKFETRLRCLRRPQTVRPERHRVRSQRWILVHRPRQRRVRATAIVRASSTHAPTAVASPRPSFRWKVPTESGCRATKTNSTWPKPCPVGCGHTRSRHRGR